MDVRGPTSGHLWIRGRCSVAVVVSSACVFRNVLGVSERLGGESEGEGSIRLLKAKRGVTLYMKGERPALE